MDACGSEPFSQRSWTDHSRLEADHCDFSLPQPLLAHTGVVPALIGHDYPAIELTYALVSPHCLIWPEVGI